MRWKTELARDFVALGGLPFFVLVLIRVWILDNLTYFMQFFVAGVVVGVIWIFVRQNYYVALSFVALFFTGMYYADFVYWVFGSIVWIGVVGCSWYLSRNWKKVVVGILVGIFSVGVSFIYPSL